jgi:hypothetical protein
MLAMALAISLSSEAGDPPSSQNDTDPLDWPQVDRPDENDVMTTMHTWTVVAAGNDTTDESDLDYTWLYLIIVIIVILIIIAAVFMSIPSSQRETPGAGKKDRGEAEAPVDSFEHQWQDRVHEENAREARIRADEEREARRKAKADRTFHSGSEGVEPVAASRSPRPTPVVASTVEDRAQKEALVATIEALPHGLPPSLGLFDAPTIAIRIIRGRKREAHDGKLIAFIQGDWYYVDPRDLDSFLKAYRE